MSKIGFAMATTTTTTTTDDVSELLEEFHEIEGRKVEIKKQLKPKAIDLLREIEEMKLSIKSQLLIIATLLKNAQDMYCLSSLPESISESRKFTNEAKYNDKKTMIDNFFNGFRFRGPNVILYGGEGNGQLICKYGFTDYYKNAIWIHTHVLEELLFDYPHNLPGEDPVDADSEDNQEYVKNLNAVREDIQQYIDMLEKLYKIVEAIY